MSAEIAAVPAAARLRITETFLSLQGEADAVGWPTFFIRLTGCPLRCHYCDTAYAFHGGEWRTIARLFDEARQSGACHVCVTGGEPLAQRQCLTLLTVLCEGGFEVSLETSGAIDASTVDERVVRVIDIKTPGSGESQRNLELGLQNLRLRDQLKFVICDRADYEWSRDRVRTERLESRCQVLFSPSYQQVPAAQLANWILADRLPVRFQIQLHKMLWETFLGAEVEGLAGSPAVVLVSGGLDSATVLAIARERGHRCHALSFDYGQRHRVELEAARRVASSQDAVEHRVLAMPIGAFGHSALTDPAIPVPVQPGEGIPVTYVPARNTIFLACALGFAEVVGAQDIYIGVNAVDYSGYPDCRPAFIRAFEYTANLATKAAVEGRLIRIQAPLIELSKADIICRGVALGVDYAATVSCYQPDNEGRACGRCDSCRLRRAGFEAAGVPDPTRYR